MTMQPKRIPAVVLDKCISHETDEIANSARKKDMSFDPQLVRDEWVIGTVTIKWSIKNWYAENIAPGESHAPSWTTWSEKRTGKVKISTLDEIDADEIVRTGL